jgi:two-component system chemotaxis response regulator CheB
LKGHDVIVIGASAGGIEALTSLVGELKADLPAAVFVVLHVPSDARSALPAILERAGPLPAVQAADDAPIVRGRIYVAPPDRHMLVEADRVRVVTGPRENRVRPSADPLFRSAARHFGPRAVGVILSGVLDDGANGLAAIGAAGGVTIVQDPQDALFGGMPESAAARCHVDYCLPADRIGPLLVRLARSEPMKKGGTDLSDELMRDPTADAQPAASRAAKRNGAASGFTCPDCHGSLWELKDGDAARYECRVGHAYSLESMLSAQAESVENALWAALNALEERAATMERVAKISPGRSGSIGGRLVEQAHDTAEQAKTLREALLRSIASHRGETGTPAAG